MEPLKSVSTMKTTLLSLSALAALCLMNHSALADEKDAGFVTIFNGTDLSGWKSNEEVPDSFAVQNGELQVVNGRAHLFYVGDNGAPKLKNFELKLKAKHSPNSNSGIYIHTEFQEKGWPEKGFECQVNSTAHKDPKKTGGLYGVKDVLDKAPVEDDVWFDYHIIVKDKTITIKINDVVTTEWTQPDDWDPTKVLKNMDGRKLLEDGGTIAIQGHDPVSRVFFKDIKLKKLD